jgi:hypothetical protein
MERVAAIDGNDDRLSLWRRRIATGDMLQQHDRNARGGERT